MRDDPLDLVEVADGGVQRAEQVDRDGARRLLAGGGVDVAAELADPDLAVALGDVARDVDELAGADEGNVGAGRDGERRQGDIEIGETVVNRGHGRFASESESNPTHPRWQDPAAADGWWRCAGVAVGACPAVAAGRPLAVDTFRHRGRGGGRGRWRARGRGEGRAIGRGRAGAGNRAGRKPASSRLAETLPAELEGRDIVVTGVVANLPEQGRAGRASASRSTRAALPPVCRVSSRSVVRGLPRGRGAGERCAWRCARPALALHRAPARAVRQPQPARLRRRGGVARAGCSCDGYVRDVPVMLLDVSAGHPVEVPAPARSRRDLRARRRSAVSSACWRRSRTATRCAIQPRRLGPVPKHRRRPPDVASAGLHVTMFAWLAGAVIGAAWGERQRRAMRRLLAQKRGAMGEASAPPLRMRCFAGWACRRSGPLDARRP